MAHLSSAIGQRSEDQSQRPDAPSVDQELHKRIVLPQFSTRVAPPKPHIHHLPTVAEATQKREGTSHTAIRANNRVKKIRTAQFSRTHKPKVNRRPNPTTITEPVAPHEAVLKQLMSRNEQIQKEAANNLRAIVLAAKPAVIEAIMTRLTAEIPDNDIHRYGIARGLRYLCDLVDPAHDPRIFIILMDLLKDTNPSIQKNAAKAFKPFIESFPDYFRTQIDYMTTPIQDALNHFPEETIAQAFKTRVALAWVLYDLAKVAESTERSELCYILCELRQKLPDLQRVINDILCEEIFDDVEPLRKAEGQSK